MPVCHYSTNPVYKLQLQRAHFGGIHYVWCSEYHDARAPPTYSAHAMTGQTSNPADIFRELAEAVRTNDRHATKVRELRNSIRKRAILWHQQAKISDAVRDDIVYQCKHGPIDLWKPLLYVIPRAAVDGRLKAVAPAQRASVGPEFILEDLTDGEFDVLVP